MKTIKIFNILAWTLVAVLIGALYLNLTFGASYSILGIDFSRGSGFESGNEWGEHNGVTLNPMPSGQASEQVVQVVEDFTKLNISWVDGGITFVESTDGTCKIVQKASHSIPDRKKMQVSHSGDTLNIRQKRVVLGINLFGTTETYLEIHLPKETYQKVSIDGVSADINWDFVDCIELEIASVSGKVNLSGKVDDASVETVSSSIDCKDLIVHKFDANTVSGKVEFEGQVSFIDTQSVSGAISIETSVMPMEIDVEQVSGSTTIALPENDGFRVEVEKMITNFKSDFETTKNGDIYTYKGGGPLYSIEAISGSVKIVRLP